MRVPRIAAALAGAAVLLAGATVPAQATSLGSEGCSPGYWKNHTDNWEEYQTSTKLRWIFDFASAPAEVRRYQDATFQQALSFRGGPGLSGATQILMRAGVAAYLNAAHDGLGYPYRRTPTAGYTGPVLRQEINAALASGDRARMLELARFLDEANNLGCPLN